MCTLSREGLKGKSYDNRRHETQEDNLMERILHIYPRIIIPKAHHAMLVCGYIWNKNYHLYIFLYPSFYTVTSKKPFKFVNALIK